MSIISFSKSVKHYLWVNYVKDGNGLDKIRSWYSQKNPYSYDLEKYTHRIGDVVCQTLVPSLLITYSTIPNFLKIIFEMPLTRYL